MLNIVLYLKVKVFAKPVFRKRWFVGCTKAGRTLLLVVVVVRNFAAWEGTEAAAHMIVALAAVAAWEDTVAVRILVEDEEELSDHMLVEA